LPNWKAGSKVGYFLIQKLYVRMIMYGTNMKTMAHTSGAESTASPR